MGLLGSKETKEEKKQRQAQETALRLGLDNLTSLDTQSVKYIINILASNGLMELGSLLSGGSNVGQDIANTYLNAIVEQNWVIIRKLDEISKKLDH